MSFNLDDLDKKILDSFPGKVVRKDLVQRMKSGANVPVFVLEYLLGKYCSSNDPEVISQGEVYVRETLAQHYFRADEVEKVKSYIKETSPYRVIDRIKVKLVETGDKYWAELSNLGITYINIPDTIIKENEKLLEGGIWAIIDITYDPEIYYEKKNRPFVVEKLRPIQLASLDFEEFRANRKLFNREEWIDFLVRSTGLESNLNEFSFRNKMLYVARLIPIVENNYNLIELGPRGTGKSYLYRELSPFTILISGGKTTEARLFYNLSTRKVGLVGLWDVVAFDEVANMKFSGSDSIQIMKDYMESGSFSRGSDPINANASIVFNGNIDGDIDYILKTSNLFYPLPSDMQDLAFIDRIHSYLPGWEIMKMKPEFFTHHFGFVADYFAEILRESRKYNYTGIIDKYFRFGSMLNQRDAKAVRKTVSGFIKLLHPDGNFTKAELEEYIGIAMEFRRRVKEQLKKMGGMEYWAVSFSYIDLETNSEIYVTLPEQSAGSLIAENITTPGVAYTIGLDANNGRNCLFRIESQTMKGNGTKKVTGFTSKPMKEAIQTAIDYIKANSNLLTIDKNLRDYDLHVQVINLMQSKEGTETGTAFFISILSSLLEKSIRSKLIVLGEMTIQGRLLKVQKLTEKLQVAVESGGKIVLIPSENKTDFSDIPSSILDNLDIQFYSDPKSAALKALNLV